MDFEDGKMEFKYQEKNVDLADSEGGHHLVKLELVGTWKDVEAVFLVKNEEDVTGENAVKKIYKILNHKSKEQMYYAYRNAGKRDTEVKKIIDNVVKKCEICKKNICSRSRSSVAVPRVTDFNSVVAIDLKVVGDKNISWMIYGFTKFI